MSFLVRSAIIHGIILLQSLTETIEFDFRVLGDGRSASARYANNSNYRNDSLIRKESMCDLMFDLDFR
jgi:hypothetical protein